jgi:hypothetical protein
LLFTVSWRARATDAPAAQPEPETVAVSGYSPECGVTVRVGVRTVRFCAGAVFVPSLTTIL